MSLQQDVRQAYWLAQMTLEEEIVKPDKKSKLWASLEETYNDIRQ